MSSVRDRLRAKLAAKRGEAPPAPETPAEETPAPAPAPKAAPKKSAAANAKAALVAKLQKQKELEDQKRAWEAEQERLQKEEEERLAAAAEAERQRQAEEAEKRRLEREQLRKEGKLLTAKQKAEQERAARMRELLISQGLFDPTQVQEARQTQEEHRKKNKGPVKTRAQLEAERIKQDMERREAEKKKITADAVEAVHGENTELFTQYTEVTGKMKSIEEELAEINKKLEELNVTADTPEEEEEELDDWDAESDDEANSNAKEIESLNSKKQTLQSSLDTLTVTFNDVNGQLQILYKQKEQDIYKAIELQKKEEEAKRIEAENQEAKNHVNLRSPIIVILGHVDSGKTSLLDRIRNSSVTKGEAGGITQQIGATYVPGDSIKKMCEKLPPQDNIVEQLKVPGLLCIDTPGHESFSMLRSRGSDICDMAILVVDIQKGLQNQTIESIQILRERKTPFIVAITKVDALYGWDKNEAHAFNPIRASLDVCNGDTKYEYDKLMKHAVASFAEQRLNAAPFYDNPDTSKFISLVPVSSKTGEGIPDLLNLLCELTQTRMEARLSKSHGFRCTILEVKQLEGYGMTLDCILVNGTLREGDTIVCAGLAGPVVTQVRTLLTPPPLKDQKTKVDYEVKKIVHAAMGLKIAAPNLAGALAGSDLFVLGPRDDLEELQDRAQEDLQSVLSRLDTENNGVFVHASSLGSLEALLTYLREEKIPISGFDIGPVHKASVTKASVQLDKQKPEYAVILAFDVKVNPDAQAMADKMDIKIFQKDVIYHLNELCVKHFAEIREKQKAEAKPVFPVVVKPMGKNYVFHNSDPLVLGLRVVAGSLRIGTPLFIPQENNLQLGRVTTIKKDNQDVQIAHKGDEVSVGIDQKSLAHVPVYGRQFEDQYDFISFMNRANVDNLRLHYPDELTETDNKLMDKFIQLKYVQ